MSIPNTVILSILLCVGIFILIKMITTNNYVIKLEEIIRERHSAIKNAIKNREILYNRLNIILNKYLGHIETTTKTLSEIKSIISNYPRIFSNSVIKQLFDEISDNEEIILNTKYQYNSSITKYNTYIRSFPNNILILIKIYNFPRV